MHLCSSFTRIGAVLLFLIIFPMPAKAVSASPPTPPVDLSPWQRFLTKYIDTSSSDGINRVRYASVKASDKADLNSFLANMQKTIVTSMPKADQQAFWINLYNARTIAVVLEHYPFKSIRDLKLAGTTKTGPWDAKLMQVEGKALSLNDIENGILRVQWKDNRIHFALNCASIGCPNLSIQAFTAENTEAQMEVQTRAFLRTARALSITGEKVKISSIFDWYRADFGGKEKSILEFIAKYSPPQTAKKLSGWSGKIDFVYDWNLNEVK